MSFAQFEREVTGERIRDKFATSKKKGMWMDRPPPLGYDVVERKLLTNSAEAKQVEHIYKRFIALGSIAMLARELNNQGYRTKSYVSQTRNKQGGKVFSLQASVHNFKEPPISCESTSQRKIFPWSASSFNRPEFV